MLENQPLDDQGTYEQLSKDFAVVFGSMQGKRVIAHLERMFFYRRTTSSENPYITAHNEGMRSAILYIKDKIDEGNAGGGKEVQPIMTKG